MGRSKKDNARLEQIFNAEIIIKHHPYYDDPTKIKEFMGEMPKLKEYEAERKRIKTIIPPDTNSVLLPTYVEPLLSKEQEVHLFLKYNYLKLQALQLRKFCQENPPRTTVRHDQPYWKKIKRIEKFLKKADEIRNHLALANARLAPRIVKKFYSTGWEVEDIYSEVYHSIWYAVLHFEVARGYKFSTYATWVAHKNFCKTLVKEKTHQDRFRTTESISDTQGKREDVDGLDYQMDNERFLKSDKILATLSKRSKEAERRMFVIRHRFGIGKELLTLHEIGKRMDIGKERVRQLELQGLEMLRKEMDSVPLKSLMFELLNKFEHNYNCAV